MQVHARVQDHASDGRLPPRLCLVGHSGKAAYLGERLRASGVEFHAPDLNLPDFSTLTVTRMLEQTRALHRRPATAPVTLIGSSLGAFVAVNAAVKWPDGSAGSS